tara:strand:- start:386 stop:925 length:540 start_codon:yes stop_codon:yes gene_type:complete
MIEIYDDFCDDIGKRNAQAEQATYKDEDHLGETYHQIARLPDDRDDSLAKDINALLGTEWNHMAFLRRGHNPTGWVHADTSCGGYAGILFLNGSMGLSGTATWLHHKYGASSQGLNPSQIEEVNGDANDEGKWELSSVVHGRKNRLILYPADTFHSVWPREGRTDRLVEVIFMDDKQCK